MNITYMKTALVYLISISYNAVAMDQSIRASSMANSRLMVAKSPALRLWLLQQVKPTPSFAKGNHGFVKRAAINGSNDRMVTLVDHEIYCDETSTGNCLWVAGGDVKNEKDLFFNANGFPRSVAFNNTGSRVAVTYTSNLPTRLYDGTTGNIVAELKSSDASQQMDSAETLCATFNPDGTKLATGSRNRTIKIWNAENGNLERTIERHCNAINCVQYDSQGDLIVSGADDMKVVISRPQLQEDTGTVTTLHESPVYTVSFSVDRSKIISGSKDKTARIWDVTGKAVLYVLEHNYAVRHAALSPAGDTLATSDGQVITTIWDLRQAKAVQTFAATMQLSECLLLDKIQQAYSCSKLFKLENHPLKPVFEKLPAEIQSLVGRYVAIKE